MTTTKIHWNISKEVLIKVRTYAAFRNISHEAAASKLLEVATANISMAVE